MKTSLGKPELYFYFASWIYSNFFSLYYLYAVQEDLFHNGTLSFENTSELHQGWAFLSRYKDNSDPEWLTWKHYCKMSWFALVIHFLGSEIIRNWNRSLLTYWYIIFTLGFSFLKFGFSQMALMILLPILYMSTLHTCQYARVAIWILSVIILPSMNWLKNGEYIWEITGNDKDEDVYLTFICLGWCQARCMSFCFDQMNRYNNENTIDKIKRRKNFNIQMIQILAYCLYFPTFYMGPFILFSDFESSLNVTQTEPLSTRLSRAFCNLSITMTYLCLMDFTLHYIYFLALSTDITYVRILPSMALCGAGLWMGAQFHLKYVVMYGTAGAIARLDHVAAPPTPRCVLRIHLYSHMWKYFDVGLYRFLTLYFYKPALSAMSNLRISAIIKKMIASSLIFVFVFFWHGATFSILIWAILNYIGVLLESMGSAFGKTEKYASFYKDYLKTARMEERFKAFISTPLLTMSALSNFYLFAGVDVGNIFVEKFFSESWYNILFIYFCLYSCCHVSMALTDVPSRTGKTIQYLDPSTANTKEL